MAQQITIDIVAETKKLTSGINDANNQIEGMSTKLKGAAAAAGAAASAFVLKQGVTFLKQGIDEAKEATETMRAATTTFGEGSAALAKITADAEKFGKEIAVDNDVIIQLATQLGSRLPKDSKAASAELVNLAFDIQAYTGGAINAEAVTGKLAKAFADGQLTAKELTKIVPDLDDATYAMAETMSKAGNNQGALNLLIEAGQKKYGDAAEKNVTASQKFDIALANLKETIGLKVLPILEKGIDFLTKLLDAFSALPGPIQNLVLGLTAVVGIGGPLLGFLASAKTSLATLGLVTGTTTGAINLAAIATNLLKVAFAGLGIGLLIAAIVLLVQNWDKVTEVVGKVWNAIKNFASDAWEALKGFASKVTGFVKSISDAFNDIPENMLKIGVNIVKGLWNGMSSMVSWFKDKIFGFFGGLLPDWAEKALGIASPSKVFASIGSNVVQGVTSAWNKATGGSTTSVQNRASAGIAVPVASLPSLMLSKQAPINITINAGLGTNGAALGRQVSSAIKQYGKVSNKAVGGSGGGGSLVML